MRKRYEVIGLMSGTSLDGLDLVKCSFVKKEKWLFTLQNFKTHAYDNKWTSILKKLHKKPKKIIEKYDLEYSKYLSNIINDFISKYPTDDLVLSVEYELNELKDFEEKIKEIVNKN